MLHPLAKEILLRVAGGFDAATLLDFHIAFFTRLKDLDALASRTSRRACAQDDIDRLDAPLVVGRVALRRPSVAAMDWLRTCAAPWWGNSRRAYAYALAYACAHREEAAFVPLRSKFRASFITWKWALRTGASDEALRRSALALLPPPDESLRWFANPDEPDVDDPNPPDLIAIATRLSAHNGGTVAHWLYEVADEDFWKAVCDFHDEDEAKTDKERMFNGMDRAEDTWWKRHRKALVKCEEALTKDVAAWVEKRKPAAQPETANG